MHSGPSYRVTYPLGCGHCRMQQTNEPGVATSCEKCKRFIICDVCKLPCSDSLRCQNPFLKLIFYISKQANSVAFVATEATSNTTRCGREKTLIAWSLDASASDTRIFIYLNLLFFNFKMGTLEHLITLHHDTAAFFTKMLRSKLFIVFIPISGRFRFSKSMSRAVGVSRVLSRRFLTYETTKTHKDHSATRKFLLNKRNYCKCCRGKDNTLQFSARASCRRSSTLRMSTNEAACGRPVFGFFGQCGSSTTSGTPFHSLSSPTRPHRYKKSPIFVKIKN